jgi:predicted secreted protein
MTAGISAKGTLLQRSTDGGTTYVTVSEITDHNVDFSADDIDMTSHQTTGPWRERIIGLMSAQISCDLNFIPGDVTHSGTAGVVADFKNRLTRHYKLITASNVTLLTGFKMVITSLSFGFSVDGKESLSVTFANDGPPVAIN